MSKQTAQELNIHRLLSPEAAAEILGVTPGTLSVWACTGRYNLKFVKIGRKRMYRLADLRDFIERRVCNGHHGAA